MNILHVLASMDPATGGPPAVVSRLAAGQVICLGDSARVTILSHESPGKEQQIAQSLQGIPAIDRVSLTTIPPELMARTMIPAAGRAAIRGLLANADVVHIHGVWDPIVWTASVEARKAGVPYVITPHGMLDPWCLRQSWLKKKIALAVGYRRMLQKAACLHLLNDDESNLIAPLRLQNARRVIPNGVFLEEIEPLPEKGTFHAAHPELKERPFILFLSRLHYKKGLDYLAEAFAVIAPQLPDVHLVVAGPDGGAQADFQQRIAGSGLTDRVHAVGSIYGRDKYAAMVDAACFCLPSRQEGFSMAITEAIACGTPVVISENCHFPEIATAGAGEVVKLSSDDVAAGLVRVMSDPSKREAMGKQGRKLVCTRYTWTNIAKQAIEMYRAAGVRR